jgi:hypothetical protein
MQRIEIEMPNERYESAVTQSFTDNAVEFHYDRTRTGNKLVLHYTLATLRDHVPANEVQQHLATLDSIWNSIGYNLPLQPARKPFSPTLILTTFVLVLGTIAGGAFVVQRVVTRRQPVHAEPRAELGRDPSTPIPIRAAESRLKQLRSLRCRCGFRFEFQKEPFTEETILFDGERITVFRGQCTQCRAEQDLYFKEVQAAAVGD